MKMAMKNSGNAWIGIIPESWSVKRIKTIFSERVLLSENGTEPLLSVSEYYGVSQRTDKIDNYEYISRAASLVGYKKCYKEDLVSNIMLAWKGCMGITEFDGIVSPAYCVYKPSQSIYPKYYHYLFRTSLYTSIFRLYSKGIIDSRLRLYSPYFFNIPAIIPLYNEQKAIADFLDKKCAEIDSLVAVQEQMLEELRAYKQSLITETVTHGLNPSAPMRDSGIPWIGEIPQEWKVFRLKNICTVQNGFAFDSSKFNIDYGVPIIRIRDITSGKSETYYSGEFNNAYIVTKNDLLVGMDGDFNVRWWESIDGLLNQRCCRILIPNTTIRRYAFYSLPRALKYINDLTYGTTVKHLSSGDIENTFITMPSQLLDLKQIVDYLDAKCAEIDELIATKQQKIETLKEYKKSIIYEYVTGKKEVADE